MASKVAPHDDAGHLGGRRQVPRWQFKGDLLPDFGTIGCFNIGTLGVPVADQAALTLVLMYEFKIKAAGVTVVTAGFAPPKTNTP